MKMILHWVAIVSLFIGISCSPDSTSDSAGVDRQGPGARLGLLVIDGTTITFEDQSLLQGLFASADVGWKSFLDGADLAGSNMRRIVEVAKTQICHAWLLGNSFDRVAILGFSRGAIAAATVAQELSYNDGCLSTAASGAYPTLLKRKSSNAPVISWVGMIDPVNTLNLDMPPEKTMTADHVESCFIAYKLKRQEHVLSSLLISGCEEMDFDYPHSKMGSRSNTEVAEALKKAAEDALGIQFSSNLSSTQYSDIWTDAQCRLFTSVGGNIDTRRFCMEMGCDWTSDGFSSGRDLFGENPNGRCVRMDDGSQDTRLFQDLTASQL